MTYQCTVCFGPSHLKHPLIYGISPCTGNQNPVIETVAAYTLDVRTGVRVDGQEPLCLKSLKRSDYRTAPAFFNPSICSSV